MLTVKVPAVTVPTQKYSIYCIMDTHYRNQCILYQKYLTLLFVYCSVDEHYLFQKAQDTRFTTSDQSLFHILFMPSEPHMGYFFIKKMKILSTSIYSVFLIFRLIVKKLKKFHKHNLWIYQFLKKTHVFTLHVISPKGIHIKFTSFNIWNNKCPRYKIYRWSCATLDHHHSIISNGTIQIFV